MKNFTKQNFKTNPLWIRLLIMTFLLLIGTSSAWGWTVIYDNTDTQWDEVYLYVGKDDWSECNLKMTEYDNNLFVFKGSGWDDAKEVVFADKALGGSTTGSICTKLKNDNAINPKVTYSINKDFSKIYKYKATGLTSSDASCSGEVRYYWPDSNSMVETTFSGNMIQLAGSFNDWGSSTDYCVSTNNSTCSFEKELAANDKYEFKIIIDGTWYSSGGSISVGGNKVTFYTDKGNSYFKAASDGIYTFNIDKDKKVWITYRTTCTPPDAPFEGVAQSETICKGSTYEFDSNYKWYTGSTGETTVSGSKEINSNTDYYIVNVAPEGCESERTKYTINVDEPLVAPTLIPTNPTTCDGNPTAGSIVIENYANYSNEISFALYKDENPTGIAYNNGYAISEEGSYKVVMTTSASNVCGQSVETDPISIEIVDVTPTVKPFNISLSATVCEGNPFTMSYDGTEQNGDISYEWYEGANNQVIGTESSLEIAQAKNTTYKLKITVTSNNCPASDKAEISVEPKKRPSAPTFDEPEKSVCVNEQFYLPIPTNLQDGEDGLWTVKGQPTTQSQTLDAAGDYTYKAYINNGCPSEGTDFTVHVNPLPAINAISVNNSSPVINEDVLLTVEGSDIARVEWSITSGNNASLSDASGNSVKLTSSTAGTVKIKATATSENSCTKESNELSVTFANETCNNVADMTKIYLDVSENTGFITGNNAYVSVTASGNNSANCDNTSGANQNNYVPKNDTWWGTMTKVAGENYIYEITIPDNVTINKGTTKLSFWNNRISGNSDVWEVQAILGQTISAGTNCMKLSNKTKTHNDDRHSHLYCGTWTTYKNAPTITAPAVKTVSVVSDEDGNVTMVGQVVKTGCDTQAILGLQYKKQKQDGTYDDNYTTYPNPGTKEAISAGKTFTVTTKLEDGTYLVRARIDNSHATNGYGEDIKVVVNTTKTPISRVTLDYCDKNGGSVGVNPNPMCKGAIAYVKLSYVGSKYSDIKWLVEGVETNLVTDEGDGVWSYEIQGDGSLSVELKNDANTDPAWPYSNKLPFEIIPEPTAPYISIDPASGVICQGSSATIKVENPSTDCSYKLVEGDTKADFTQYESGDLKYTVQNVGKYYVVARHDACTDNEYTSNQVAINQIISTNANISIDPAKAETTPWEPVTITVKPDAGYIYELTYTDGNLAAVDGVRIKQNGDSYTYYIPRPDAWTTGDSDPVRDPINYVIKAQLKVDGEESECKLKDAAATIQLKDEDNEDCPK